MSGYTYPAKVELVEVGPRDGLQSEKMNVPTPIKLALISQLAAAGLKKIEATSFVSPKAVPQMADHAEVMQSLDKQQGVDYPVLVPNLKGLTSAIDCGAKEIAVFISASETFSKANINCSVAESLQRVREVLRHAEAADLRVRAYVSCVLGCPYEGAISPHTVSNLAQELIGYGCYQVSLGDTIGVGTPGATAKLLDAVSSKVSVDRLAGHFHDTYGQALANILIALQAGVTTFDTSVAGLGGCPYAKGATGNVATEDVLFMLDGLGISTGVDLAKVRAAGEMIFSFLGRPSQSRVANALSKVASHNTGERISNEGETCLQ
jgi:hydroxymethylglutaryl-CoA lyase